MADLGTGGGSSYPGAIDTSTPKVNNTDTVSDFDFNDQSAAILAIESILGTNPQGSKSTVKALQLVEHGSDGTHLNNKVALLAGEQKFTGHKYLRTFNFGVDTGVADAHLVSPISSFAAADLVNGLFVIFESVSTNTGATTINLGGTGVKDLKRYGRAGTIALQAGDIVAGNYYVIIYDFTNTQYIVLNPSSIPLSEIITADINALAVTEAKLAVDAVNWVTKIKQATAGDSPYFDASGNPQLLAKGTDGFGYTLVSGVPAWTSSIRTEVITADKTWIRPEGVTKVLIEALGAGGSGSGGTVSGHDTGGGGGGSWIKALCTVSGNITVQVGVGPTGTNTTGTSGEDSTFGSLVTAKGGSGGQKADQGAGGIGGVLGSTTQSLIDYRVGNDGGAGVNGDRGGSGGRPGPWDVPAEAGNQQTASDTNGNDGSNFGEGGSGVRVSAGSPIGGDGSDGYVIVSW